MAIYLKIEGDFPGNVTSSGHEDWIEVESMQFGVGRGITMAVGSSKDREASEPSVSEIVVTKMMDATSPKIFREACIGKSKKVEIHLVRTTEGNFETYMEYVLSSTLISGYSVSSGGDRPSESITFNFTKIEMNYVKYKDDHTKDGNIPASYDLALGNAS